MVNESTDPDEQDAAELREVRASVDADAESEVLDALVESGTLSDRTATELRELVEADETATPAAEISVGRLFELLASPGNRYVLTYLLRAESPATYSELVGYVVDHARPPADLTEGKFRGRVAARLVHTNLPTLEDAGLIEHDTEEHRVTATPAIETVAPYLALAISQSRPRAE